MKFWETLRNLFVGCPYCGGKLKEQKDGKIICQKCGHWWIRTEGKLNLGE